MNELDRFPFFRNYYEVIKHLKNEDKLIMLDAIFEYMFEDKEPELEGLLLGIWKNIEIPLNKGKTSIVNGKKGGAPKGNTNAKKTTQKQPKNNLTYNRKTTKPSVFYFLFSILSFNNIKNKNKIEELLKEYLDLRVSKKYVLSESVVKRLINKLNDYGKTDEDKIEIIQKAINGGWKDFYPLKEKNTSDLEDLPEWWDYKEEEKNEELRRKAEAIRNGTYRP